MMFRHIFFQLNISLIYFIVLELVEGLTRAQRRLEDQRGTEINFELPDFLKDKENQEQSLKNQQKQSGLRSETRFYLDDTSSVYSTQDMNPISSVGNSKTNMYENRSILVPGEESQDQTSSLKNNVKFSSSSENTSSQMTSNIAVLEENIQGRHSDPPPLPPKPKIVPIKPPNWGQLSSYTKFKEMKSSHRNQTMFLEQPSSSFV